MKVLLYLDVDCDAITPRVKPRDEDEASDLMDAKDSIIEGLTSVDMERAIGGCLADWYLQVMDSDVNVSTYDAIEVLPVKDRRKLLSFKLRQFGGLRQENVR